MRESERDLSMSGQRAGYHHGGWKGDCLAEASQVAPLGAQFGFSLMTNRSRHCDVWGFAPIGADFPTAVRYERHQNIRNSAPGQQGRGSRSLVDHQAW